MSSLVWQSVCLVLLVATVYSSSGKKQKSTETTTLSTTIPDHVVFSAQSRINTQKKSPEGAQSQWMNTPSRLSSYCRIASNLNASCENHQIVLNGGFRSHLTKMCSETDIRGRQTPGFLSPPNFVGMLRLVETKMKEGRTVMARYTVLHCKPEESPCGVLVSRYTDTGHWTAVKGNCCRSIFRERHLIRANRSLEIPWRFLPGTQIVIRGYPFRRPEQITFNFKNDTDLILHVGLRFNLHGDSHVVVIDRMIGGFWRGAQKIQNRFPFRIGKPFVIRFEATENRFVVREKLSNLRLGSQDYEGTDGSTISRMDYNDRALFTGVHIMPYYGFP